MGYANITPAAVQVALLRVLQEGEFERLGSSHTRSVDRQLQNVRERSAILCDQEMLRVPPAFTSEPSASPHPPSALEAALDEGESRLIADALERAGGRVSGRTSPGGPVTIRE